MRDAGFIGIGIVVGWLGSKSWSDPDCRLGLAIFLAATAIMFLVFALAVVGHGKEPPGSNHPEDDD